MIKIACLGTPPGSGFGKSGRDWRILTDTDGYWRILTDTNGYWRILTEIGGDRSECLERPVEDSVAILISNSWQIILSVLLVIVWNQNVDLQLIRNDYMWARDRSCEHESSDFGHFCRTNDCFSMILVAKAENYGLEWFWDAESAPIRSAVKFRFDFDVWIFFQLFQKIFFRSIQRWGTSFFRRNLKSLRNFFKVSIV